MYYYSIGGERGGALGSANFNGQSYLVLRESSLHCRPGAVGTETLGGGTTKVAELDGSLGAQEEVLNLGQKERGELLKLCMSIFEAMKYQFCAPGILGYQYPLHVHHNG